MLTKAVKRDLKHNRTIKGKGYKREDGLWDIEVFLLDTKTFSFKICIEVILVQESRCMIWLLD